MGQEGDSMERSLAEYLGVRRSLLVNSGSSANLLAISSLTSHKLPSERRLMKGDEVITCAAGFPTTVAPIIQNGAVPVFLDNNPSTSNVDTFHYWRKLTILKKQKQLRARSCALEIHSICPQSSPFASVTNCGLLRTIAMPLGSLYSVSNLVI